MFFYKPGVTLEHLTASKQTEVLEGLLDVSEGSNQKDVLTT